MYLTHKYAILQMMHLSGHKTQKTFMDFVKLSSDEIAAMAKKDIKLWYLMLSFQTDDHMAAFLEWKYIEQS